MSDKNEKQSALALPEEYYKQNANVGLSGLSVEDVPTPTLTVVQSNSKMKDEEGRPLIPGKLYYKALRASYDVVECSILVITKKEMPSYEDKSVLERTYMVLGVMMPGEMPFLMYNKSSAYFSTRQFIGEVKARKMPMYTLQVQISTERRQNNYGEWYMPKFTILGVETNSDRIMVLEELAKQYDMNRDSIRSEEEEQRIKASSETIEEDGKEENRTVVSSEEVPF